MLDFCIFINHKKNFIALYLSGSQLLKTRKYYRRCYSSCVNDEVRESEGIEDIIMCFLYFIYNRHIKEDSR